MPSATPHELVEKLVTMLSCRQYSPSAVNPHSFAMDVIEVARMAGGWVRQMPTGMPRPVLRLPLSSTHAWHTVWRLTVAFDAYVLLGAP
jgi:hypothetical protein